MMNVDIAEECHNRWCTFESLPSQWAAAFLVEKLSLGAISLFLIFFLLCLFIRLSRYVSIYKFDLYPNGKVVRRKQTI